MRRPRRALAPGPPDLLRHQPAAVMHDAARGLALLHRGATNNVVVLVDELGGALNSHECRVDVGVPVGRGISRFRLGVIDTWHRIVVFPFSFLYRQTSLSTICQSLMIISR